MRLSALARSHKALRGVAWCVWLASLQAGKLASVLYQGSGGGLASERFRESPGGIRRRCRRLRAAAAAGCNSQRRFACCSHSQLV